MEARVKGGRASLRYSAGSKVGDVKFGKVVVVVDFSGDGEECVRIGGVEMREDIVLVWIWIRLRCVVYWS